MQRRVYTRTDVMDMLGVGVDKLRAMERAGRLTPIKLTGPTSQTFYAIDEVEALFPKPKRKVIERRKLSDAARARA